MKCPYCSKEIENNNITLDVKELGIEVEIEVTHKGMSFKDIMALPETKEKIKKGWRLMSAFRKKDFVNEVAFLKNNHKYCSILKMESTKDDFWVEQMFEQNRKNGYVAGFGSVSGYSYLGCGGGADDSSSALGVRFVREKKFQKGKK